MSEGGSLAEVEGSEGLDVEDQVGLAVTRVHWVPSGLPQPPGAHTHQVADCPVDQLSERQWSLLLETYIDRQRLMVSNEDLGERRFQVLMTVVSAVGIALGLAAGRLTTSALQATASLAAVLLAAFACATTVRLARRDVATSYLKVDLLKIREFVATGRPDLFDVLPHMREKPAGLRPRPFYPSGGLVDLVGIVTAAFVGIAVGTALGGRLPDILTLLLAVGTALLTWVGIVLLVRRIYRTSKILRDPGDSTRSETFRANVGIVVRDEHGQVLVLERSGHPGTWQFPQGGIEPRENRRDAALRELREETGLTEQEVQIEGELGRWLAYEIPVELRTSKTGIGQVQWWFVARLTGDGTLPPMPTGEFTDHKWATWDEAIEHVASFKRPVYAELARTFASAQSR
jgi:putative (di)nucleoside polyphosphate hydrolase